MDLEPELRLLTGRLRGVVPGFLGWTITVEVSGVPVTLTAIEESLLNCAEGCLLLALAPEDGFHAGDSVVLYAAHPWAFSSLIAGTDSRHSLAGVFLLDPRLPLVTDLSHPAGISGLDEATTLNRAIGGLIDQGSTLCEAQAEMRRRASA